MKRCSVAPPRSRCLSAPPPLRFGRRAVTEGSTTEQSGSNGPEAELPVVNDRMFERSLAMALSAA